MNNIKNKKVVTDRRPLSDLSCRFFLELRSVSFQVLADMNWMFI